MPSRNLNRLLWVVFALAIVVFGLKARENFEDYFAGVGTLDVTPAADGGTLELSWRGKVEAPMAQKISEAFDKYGGDARRVVLRLSSPGGSLGEGRDVINVLQRIARSRELVTHVAAGRMCASMCVPVYLQGEERTASERARFMFHQVSFADFYEGVDENVPSTAKEEATSMLFARYFEPAGVPERWITNMLREMSSGKDIWRSGASLVQDGSTIVHRIE